MRKVTFPIALIALAAMGSAHAASLGPAGYGQDFDTMGTAGTAPPADWVVYVGNSGTSNTTWGTATGGAIPATGTNSVASMVLAGTPLTAITLPSTTNNNGYNAANLSPAPTTDRVLATSPTTVSGAALQVSLTNDTGAALAGLTVGYDTVRFGVATTVNELPGYWLFYSLDGTSWANAVGLNPSIATVPNTVGTTSSSGSFSFTSALAAGGTVLLRWVDDNAAQTSPDQIIGLNNVTVSAVPEPAAAGLFLVGLVGLAVRRKLRVKPRNLMAAGLFSLAALGTAHASNVTLAPTGTWAEFFIVDPAYNLGNSDLSWVDINDYSKITFSFTVAAGFNGTVTVVDGGFSGDVFSVASNGAALQNTSGAVNSFPNAAVDYDQALANSNFSRGVYNFGAGTYAITGALLTSALDGDSLPLNATVGALKLDVAPIPEASTLAMLMAGLGLVGLLARRRAV